MITKDSQITLKLAKEVKACLDVLSGKTSLDDLEFLSLQAGETLLPILQQIVENRLQRLLNESTDSMTN